MMCKVRTKDDLHCLVTSCQQGKIASIQKLVFRRECGLNEEKTKKGPEKIAGKHRSLEQVDAVKLKQEVAEIMIMKAVTPVSDSVQAGSDRLEDYLTKPSMLGVRVPGGRKKAGPGWANVTSMLTGLEHRAFRDDMREQTRWKRAGKAPMKR